MNGFQKETTHALRARVWICEAYPHASLDVGFLLLYYMEISVDRATVNSRYRSCTILHKLMALPLWKLLGPHSASPDNHHVHEVQTQLQRMTVRAMAKKRNH